MIKYIVFILLFLLKIGFLFGQNVDSLFHVISKKHENVSYYTIIKDTIYSNNKEKKMICGYEFVQRKHKDKIFAFVILLQNYATISSYSVRYFASKNKTDKQFTILNKDKNYSWYNIELLDLNDDNIREISINYEIGYPCNYRETYNFSTDSIAPIILQIPYDSGVLTCIDTTKNLYFNIERNNVSGMWDSELFVINKDFSKGEVLGTARWDFFLCDNCFDIYGKHKENPYTTYFSSDSKSVIFNFHPHVDHWNSKENIEFMKNAYLKMLKEFDIEY